MSRRILTEEEHKNYVHFCGKTGEELDTNLKGICKTCSRRIECLLSHGIEGVDNFALFAA